MKVSDQVKRTALALAFGVVIQGTFVTGIPGGVPGLGRAISCPSCSIKLNRSGVPSKFALYMTDEQKKTFKKAVKEAK